MNDKPKPMTFEDLVRENPDSFDDMDCRPGPSAKTAEQTDAVMSPHVREQIAKVNARRSAAAAELRGADE